MPFVKSYNNLMLLFQKFSIPRQYKTRIKRWFLGRKYRHLAKLSRNFKIESNTLFWKNNPLCNLLPFSQVIDTYHNKTAFIIASGPSIKDINISSLNDKFTFGVNGSINKFLETPFPPSFYVISDEDFIFDRPKLIEKILENQNCHCFFTPESLNAICEINPELLQGHKYITLFNNHFKNYGHVALEYSEIRELALSHPDIITDDGKIGFSLNPEKGVFTAHTITYFALQIAYGLGFRTINLLGMDLGSPTGETRFYESGATAMPSHMDRDYLTSILPSFKIVSELCKNNIFQVFNLSPISRLPNNVIKKQNFDDVIKNL